MEYKLLGNTNERLPTIGMGTWHSAREDGALAALKHGLSLGMKLIDTAEIYQSEEIVGKAIKGETGVFVASKLWANHFRHDDVIKACNDSLKRLGLKQLDLYQLHWPNRSVPISETMSAMEELQKTGKIRHIGVSNFSASELDDARAALKNSDIVSNQVEYSITMREPEQGLLDYCNRENITVIAYSPLGNGALFSPERAGLVEILGKIGKAHGATAAQIALSWLISRQQVVAIPETSNLNHVGENFGAMDVKLGGDEVRMLDSESKRFAMPSLANTKRP